jgi:hypothetical protein
VEKIAEKKGTEKNERRCTESTLIVLRAVRNINPVFIVYKRVMAANAIK